uniref:Zinc finger, CCHC-type n=1 Tax=Tanacetum cinerariifolium TaxID=118510 RepID=A0A6L2JUG8_TANCI|nr:hypothetical protein [Tanacetum cinerariifolium]
MIPKTERLLMELIALQDLFCTFTPLKINFCSLGTKFDIFQNLHILYLEYGILPSSGYGVLILFPSWSFMKCRHGYVVSSLMDTAYRMSEQEDLEVLWSIVKARFKKVQPVNDLDCYLLHTLKTMFEHHVENSVWKNQQGLAKMYPLTNYTLTQMWNNVRLQVDYEFEMACDLLRLVGRQLREGYVHCLRSCKTSCKKSLRPSHQPDIAFVVGKLSWYTSNPVSTPTNTNEKLIPTNGQAVSQLEYSRLIGYLMYVMTCSRPEIAFVVGELSAISWASKKQTCITGSTIEYEFVALAAAGKESEWLKNMLLEIPLWSKPIEHISIRCDSAATLAKAYSQMYNGKSRHLGVRHSMIHELITNGVVSLNCTKLGRIVENLVNRGFSSYRIMGLEVQSVLPLVTEHPDSDSGKKIQVADEVQWVHSLNVIHQSNGFSFGTPRVVS